MISWRFSINIQEYMNTTVHEFPSSPHRYASCFSTGCFHFSIPYFFKSYLSHTLTLNLGFPIHCVFNFASLFSVHFPFRLVWSIIFMSLECTSVYYRPAANSEVVRAYISAVSQFRLSKVSGRHSEFMRRIDSRTIVHRCCFPMTIRLI